MEPKPIAGVYVVVSRYTDNAQFFAFTDAAGHFEFPPLPYGNYEFNVVSIDRLYFGKAGVSVARGTCWDMTSRKAPFPLQ